MSARRPLTVALGGDTMLGRSVAERLERDPAAPLLAPEVVEAAREADLFVVNLECCLSERGERFSDPHKRFFFRGPPAAAERLAEAGVDAVTLANNHALDFGPEALIDTVEHLREAGVVAVGAGPDTASARAPAVLVAGGLRLRLVPATDHPAAYAAAPARPGVAFADLHDAGVPGWLAEACAPADDADAVLVLPHWGPNMRAEPVAHVMRASTQLVDAGATVVAGHSAHVFQGVRGRVLYDLGGFIDDYAVDPVLRNDLGLLWLLTLDEEGPRRLEAMPLRLDFCFTRLAGTHDAAQIRERLARACAPLGTEVRRDGDRLLVGW